MVDVFSVANRSEVMSRIRSRGSRATELGLARLFRRLGVTGWRRHFEFRISNSESRSFRVKPDFVFLKRRIALFVDGCFWHDCPRHMTKPAGNAAFWSKKLAANRLRDRTVNDSAGCCATITVRPPEGQAAAPLCRMHARRDGIILSSLR
jgi:DNA mismatch endonuclease (patch repair protein)